ncbi:hypothetical protein Pdsh_06650 [Pyrodictium delaneyi]|uniref:NADH:quinone oxidoreductase/Mrp antiporter transmembrane domain-containing protein n=1 Tax=Pyrodictium delaneyi TaxID=1273541 RepID=A0A211YNA4_9CREN|nr:hypothetical protein Pdsh_06650 [Pyrodictium delaneyi]
MEVANVLGVPVAYATSLIVLGLGAAAVLAGRRAASIISITVSAIITLLANGDAVCRSWLAVVNAPVCMGLDTVSKLFAALSALVAITVIVYAGRAGVTCRGGEAVFEIVVTAIHASVIGLVYAYSLPLFYVFWELVLIVSTVLVWLWSPRRAPEFFIYMHAGSLLLLVAVGALLAANAPVFGGNVVDASLSTIALPLALIAFAIKLGVFPFHTWLPRTYTSVPPFAAGLLAGVVTSIGAYGMYRFTTGFHWPHQTTAMLEAAMWLGITSAIVGALRALSANRLGFIASYSSIGHSGIIYAGLAAGHPLAAAGGVLAALAHGIVKPLFFLVAGVLEKQSGSDDIRSMGVFARSMPVTAFAAFVAAMSLAGAPPFAMFPGELLIVLGVGRVYGIAAVAALALAVLSSAAYALRFWLRVFWHPSVTVPRTLPSEAPSRLLVPLLILAAAAIALGVLPGPIVDSIVSLIR